MRRWFDRDVVVLALIWLGTIAYLPTFLDRGWIPHDEGVVAHSAERVLQGELPHRDFDEIYTGGLSYLHALAFRLFDVRLTSLRWMLLAFAIAFVPTLYCIARRAGPPWLAGALTAVGVVWSLPNYFAGLPSWYNLFFATFGTLAVLRHLDDGRRRWLMLAGLCGGFSILVKIAGLYFVAAVLLFLVYAEHVTSLGPEDRRAPTRAAGRATALLALEALGAIAFVAALVRTFAADLALMPLLHFVVPGAALVGLLLWSEWRDGRGPSGLRLRRLLQRMAPFAAGVAAPLVLFVVPYVVTGALDDLMRGLFVLPARRVESAAMALPESPTLLEALPYAVLLFLPAIASRTIERGLALLVAVGLAAVLATAGDHEVVYQGVWFAVRPLVPLAAVAACLFLARTPPDAGDPEHRRATVFLLVTMASLVSLVQFPYAFGIYFCYAAPLVLVAVAAVVRVRRAPSLPHLVVLIFAFVFAVVWLNPGYIRAIGVRFIADMQTQRLALDRGGLFVSEGYKHDYERLVMLARRHAGALPIYAGPDAPEVYFLTARPNPTRTLFDIFDEPAGRTERILALIDAENVKFVAINSMPEFSPRISLELAQGLTVRFPHWEPCGRFQLGWRP